MAITLLQPFNLDTTKNYTFANVTSTANISGGNASLGNLVTGNYFSGNGSLLTAIAGGNITGQVGNALIAGTVYTNAQPNITSVGTLSSLTVTANITSGNANLGNAVTANFFIGDGGYLSNVQVGAGTAITNGNSNVTVGANSNVTVGVSGNASIATFTGTGVNVSGYLNVSGNITSTNANLGNLVTANYFTGNGSLLTTITGGNVTGQVGNALIAGTVYTNAQPNITSLGTINGLTGTGVFDLTGTSNTALGAVGNVHITGGSSGQYLQTDGSGGLSWQTISVSTASISNGNSNVNIPSANGNITLSSAGNANIVVVTGTGVNVAGTLNTGSGVITTTGNISAGNANLGNAATANFFIGDGGYLSNIQVGAGTAITNGNSNVTVGANSNVTVGVSGNAAIATFTGTGVNVSGYLNVNGNITGTNANLGNLVTANYTTAVLTTGAQPNITSVGALADTTIAGNLTVNGTTIYANVTTLNVKDPIIEMGGNPNGAALTTNDGKDRGTLLHYYVTGNSTAVDAFMGWDNSNAEFAFGSNVTNSSEVMTFNDFGNVRAAYFLGNASQLTGTIANANYAAYAGVVTTNAQPNITSTGTLSSLTVSGLITATSTGVKTSNIEDSSGTVTIVTGYGSVAGAVGVYGTLTVGTSGSGNVTAYNANLGNLVTANYTTAVLTTGAQPNITSLGTLTGLTSNGIVNFTNTSNVTLGAVANLHISGGSSGQYLQTDGSGTLSWVSPSSGSSISNGTSNVNIASSGGNVTVGVSGNAAIVTVTGTGVNVAGTLNTGSGVITTTGNITAGNANLGNLVTANYTTAILTTAAQPNITSLGTINGLTGTGVFDLTGTSNTALGAVGNVHITGGSSGQYLQTDGSGGLSWQTVSATGASISNGTSNVNIATANGNVTVGVGGTANVVTVTTTGANISGYVAANTFASNISTGTAPLTVSSTTRVSNLNVSYANVSDYEVVTAQSTGTFYPVFVSGNTSGNYALGSNSSFAFDVANTQLTMGSGSGGSITGANLVSANYFTGTLTTGAQPNITSLGTMQSITMAAATSLSGGNLLSANYVTGTLTTGAQPNITSVGTMQSITMAAATSLSGGNLLSANYVTGTLTTGAQPNITSTGTLTSLTVTGNVTAGNIIGIHANGNSNVNIPAANGNVTIGVGGTANVVIVTTTGVNVAGTLNTGSGVITTTGNITAGNANLGNLVTANYTTTVLTTAAQPNITSLGTLSNLTSNGTINFTNASNVTLGNVANVHITGGSSGYFLSTDGSGTLSWAAGGGGSITDDTSTNATYYPVYATASSGTFSVAGISTTKLQYNPSTGTLTAQDLNTLSDMALKENSEQIQNPIEVLTQLFGMGFNWKDSKRKSYGLMAQMVEKVLPELVNTTAEGVKTVNYIPIIAFLIEAIKKQQEDIDSLKKDK